MKFVLIFLVSATIFQIQGQVQEYILQAGDVISIAVVEHPEFSGRHKIRPDGRINYPVIGEIDAASMTTAQLVKIMQGKLSSYVNNPVVSISIEAYYANKIFVIGAVSRPGEYQIYEPIDLLKVIAMCGGVSNSKVKLFKIIRADGTVVTINSKEILGVNTSYDTKKYLLYPGDTMFAPHSFQIPWGVVASILSVLNISLNILLITSNLSRK
ncbi:MAG: polysaccharide export protein [Chitinispirillaceae bacterium]|nr:polysaccharide export protein [Chitinispirillaceae bacterium]